MDPIVEVQALSAKCIFDAECFGIDESEAVYTDKVIAKDEAEKRFVAELIRIGYITREDLESAEAEHKRRERMEADAQWRHESRLVQARMREVAAREAVIWAEERAGRVK